MDSEFLKSAIAVNAIFGALTIGGLMAAALVFGERDSFLFALGSSTLAWGAGFAMIYEKPNAFRWLIIAATLFAVLATIMLVT